MSTHEVTNQSPPFLDRNLYDDDAVLSEALQRHGGAWCEEEVRSYGGELGAASFYEAARLANEHPPVLRSHDRFGNRIDEVEFHPAWHQVMTAHMRHRVHNLPWQQPRDGAHAARTAKHYMLAQIETGSACPITMTFACVPALAHDAELLARWKPALLGTEYDPRPLPFHEKTAVTIGMAMTEKQGGSDVRANTTRATDAGGGEYLLNGHKWFCSAPMSDAFLTLAYTDAGLSCFLVPRRLEDGGANPFRIQRLKSKLGNRSNASSEIEYDGTRARMVGEDGRGIRTIIEMVHHTRLDCVSGSAGLMRQALAQAVHHARNREAFGKRLIDQPLMQNVLADLALEVEAAELLMMRLAQAYDDGEHALARIATAIGKYWVCKRAPHLIYEAMECLGGNGYVEESILPRLFREAPVNAIWEGSGNVICLDVLRAMVREPDTMPALLEEIETAKGSDKHLDAAIVALREEFSRPADAETRARRLVERAAVALQGSLMLRYAPSPAAEAYLRSRVADDGGLCFGTLPPGCDFAAIADRALPGG